MSFLMGLIFFSLLCRDGSDVNVIAFKRVETNGIKWNFMLLIIMILSQIVETIIKFLLIMLIS